MKNILLLFFLIINSTLVLSQEKIKGKIVFEDLGINYPIGGSSIYWQGTKSGTISNDNGEFEIQKIESTNNLVISYIGFKTQIILIEKDNLLSNELKLKYKDAPKAQPASPEAG